eukprot:308923_1
MKSMNNFYEEYVDHPVIGSRLHVFRDPHWVRLVFPFAKNQSISTIMSWRYMNNSQSQECYHYCQHTISNNKVHTVIGFVLIAAKILKKNYHKYILGDGMDNHNYRKQLNYRDEWKKRYYKRHKKTIRSAHTGGNIELVRSYNVIKKKAKML